jgi:hypothetical protein
LSDGCGRRGALAAGARTSSCWAAAVREREGRCEWSCVRLAQCDLCLFYIAVM